MPIETPARWRWREAEAAVGAALLPLRLALRELRGGLAGFRIFLACLVLAVAAIAAVGSLSAALQAGIRGDARGLLGADVHLRLSHRPASAEQQAWLGAGATLSASREMRAMARSGEEEARVLVEVKAVDETYPLYGAVELDPGTSLAAALERRQGVAGAAVEASLLRRLGLAVGERILIGEAAFEVRATIVREPDRGSTIFNLGPRVMLAAEALDETGLVVPGSLIRYDYRVRLAPGASSTKWIAALNQRFPDAGWRVRDYSDAAPEVQRFIGRVALFLTLVGLTALLVGGIGIANAVRAHMEGKIETIATLKCLGAKGGLIFAVYLCQTMILAFSGIAGGLVLGALMPSLIALALARLFPFQVEVGLYPEPLALAAAYGVLAALAFALWPLAQAREVSPAGLFRHIVAPTRRWPRVRYVGALAALVAALALLAVVTADEPRFAVWFVVGALASLVAFSAVAWLVRRLAAAVREPSRPDIRLALANLHRPGAATGSVVLSLGFGLSVLVIIALIEVNLSREVEERLPATAPSFFFIDIQPDQAAAFDALVRQAPGASGLARVPSLRGRVVAIDGVAAEARNVAPEHRWVLRNDRALTYAKTPPEGTRIVAGRWWPEDYEGPPLLSVDAHVAESFGLGVGGTLTLNILGREVTATVANLREVDWTTLGINFVLIFAPGTLEGAPQSHIATVHVPADGEDALERAVTDRFANVSAIRVREALETVHDILRRIALAVRLTALVTLLAGALVLVGALAANQRRRIHESVVLKVLGATRWDLARAYAAEHALLGGASALVAAAVGSIGAWAVLTHLMRSEFHLGASALVAVAAVAGLGLVLTVALGALGTWRALGEKAAPVLRSE